MPAISFEFFPPKTDEQREQLDAAVARLKGHAPDYVSVTFGAGGTIANIGVHGTKVDLHLERLWSHNITLTTGLVDTYTTPMLLSTVASKRLEPKKLVTHRFTLDRIMDAYDTFSDAAHSEALKVVISNQSG